MESATAGMSPERRARLAEKGRILYRKSCGVNGKKTCAESFALHHLQNGEPQVVLDLLAFLVSEAEGLRVDDPDGRLDTTRTLIIRLRQIAAGLSAKPLN